MSASAELVSRVKLSSPNPAYCPACFAGSDDKTRFVDFDCAFDGGQMIEERDGVVIKRESADDLHLCERCVKQACEALGLKPERYAALARELKRVELERDHWKDYAKRVEAAIEVRPERRR